MNILFVCALPLELKKVKDIFKGKNPPGYKFFFLLSGVGNYQVIYSLREYLSQREVDFIVNIGVCGTSIESIRQKVVQVYRIKNLASGRESVIPLYFQFAPLVSIGSSERVITDSVDMVGEEYVDMESWGVDLVASKQKIPFILLKIPFDRVSAESKKVDMISLEKAFESIDGEKFLGLIQILFNSTSKETQKDLSEYIQHFGFTVAETEIFRKLHKRYKVLGKDIQTLFENNKILPKKEFLKILQEK